MKKTKAVYSFKMLGITYPSRQYNIPEDWQLHSHCHENLTTHNAISTLLFTEN